MGSLLLAGKNDLLQDWQRYCWLCTG